MERVIEANAMKKSFYQQGFVAEEVVGNGNTNCGFGADDSFVDEFLNFSKEEEQDAEEFIEEEEEEEKDSVSVSSQENSVEVSFKDAFDSLGSELCVPTDDLADLEWVSHFVDDSFNEEEFSFSWPKTTPTPNQEFKTQTPKESKSFSSVQEQQISGISSLKTFSIPPKRSRTKRTRTTNGRRIWSLGSPPSFSESSSTTTSSSSTSSSSPTSCLIFTKPQTLDFIYYLPEKKKQKPKSKSYENQNPQFQQQQYQRRCSHCGVQKTPQWRTGPMGAKTLCNACGVRFKSGRLLPEYRPACSPTFSSDVHSNNHRKVLEMRKKKETIPGSGSGLVPAVHSF